MENEQRTADSNRRYSISLPLEDVLDDIEIQLDRNNCIRIPERKILPYIRMAKAQLMIMSGLSTVYTDLFSSVMDTGSCRMTDFQVFLGLYDFQKILEECSIDERIKIMVYATKLEEKCKKVRNLNYGNLSTRALLVLDLLKNTIPEEYIKRNPSTILWRCIIHKSMSGVDGCTYGTGQRAYTQYAKSAYKTLGTLKDYQVFPCLYYDKLG